ncbi:hypothetical protein ACGH2B_05475 [Streptomyces sp. BBFR2]|uniref:hypothetical protein n=1 Tax=Streptomyces sp. BBFR2 TaxID=3372854 RepID=UPI0037D9CB32
MVAGAVWWWAVARLVWWPAATGPVESAVAAGGWGLSLLPVHCVPWAGRRAAPRQGGGRGLGALPPGGLRGVGGEAARGVLRWARGERISGGPGERG